MLRPAYTRGGGAGKGDVPGRGCVVVRLRDREFVARCAGRGFGFGLGDVLPTRRVGRAAGPTRAGRDVGLAVSGLAGRAAARAGLERAGWSHRAPLDTVVFGNRWPGGDAAPTAPPSRLYAPHQAAVVGARDEADTLVTAPGSLGVLDRAVDRVVALGRAKVSGGTLVLAVGRHLAAQLGVSAFDASVTEDVLDAARAGRALGAVAAGAAGLEVQVVDAGSSTGNLRDADPLTVDAVTRLLGRGEDLGGRLSAAGLVVLGEVGIGNTTVAAAVAAGVLGVDAEEVVGLGAGADSATFARKREVVRAALHRWRTRGSAPETPTPVHRLAALGGPEIALLTGVVLGVARAGGVIVLDGLATGVAALVAAEIEPAVAAHLIAGQRSSERAHAMVLNRLGLEPLLDLRLRAGEGVGAALAAQLLLSGLTLRATAARTHP